MARHERLLAWQHSHRLALAVYQATQSWPASERFGLTSQARRAANSVGANIAEGAARVGRKEFKRFLDVAIGSLGELDNHLRLAVDLGLISREEWQGLMDLHGSAGRLVVLLARSMVRRERS